jgi:hypothetical protein
MAVSQTDYQNLRENLSERYAELSDERLEKLLERNGMDAVAMEGFFDQLGKFASSAGQSLLKAAPSILPVAGQVIGGAFGGPLGASLGGTLGSLGGKALGGLTGQAPATGQPSGLGALFGGSSAAGQLLQTIAKPETLQALTSMALGPLGKPNVDVGGTSVPASAFGNLLKILSGRMESEYYESMAANRESVPAYMQDYAGVAKGDPAVSEHRAAALYELLDSADSDSADSAEGEAADQESYSDLETSQAEYDELELAEVYDSEEA